MSEVLRAANQNFGILFLYIQTHWILWLFWRVILTRQLQSNLIGLPRFHLGFGRHLWAYLIQRRFKNP